MGSERHRSGVRDGLATAFKAADGAAIAVAAGALLNLARKRKGAVDLSPEAFEAREPGRGRSASSPWRIPFRGWSDVVWRVWMSYDGHRIAFIAGGITFFTLLAVFPAIAAFVALYGLFFDVETVERHLELLSGFLPPNILDFIAAQMSQAATQSHGALGVAFLASLLLALWGANASVKSLIYGLNIAYRETEKRNFFTYSAITLAMTGGFLAFLLLVNGLVVAAPLAAAWFGWSWNGADLGVLRWPVLFGAYAGALTLLYRYGPCRRRARWIWIVPGGVLAALLSLAVSWLYSWYLERFAHFDATYGPLGAVLGFMVWTWWSVTAVLVSALLNAELEHQTARDTTVGAARPIGERGAVVADTLGQRRKPKSRLAYTLEGAREHNRRAMIDAARAPSR